MAAFHGIYYLEKPYDRNDKNAVWQVVWVYGVDEKLVTAVKNF